MDYKKLLYAVIVLLSSISIVFFTDKLNLYIHPRYTLFTISFIIIGLILLLIDLTTTNKKETISKSGYLVIVIAIASLLFPPQSLTAELASNRVDGSQASNSSLTPSTYDSFSRDLTRFGIEDWVGFLSSSPSVDQVAGKSANISGFITKDSSNQLYIARFKLTCCAVDASPLAVPLLESDISQQLKIGEWYILDGSFVYVPESNNNLQLSISELEPISEPKDPYVF